MKLLEWNLHFFNGSENKAWLSCHRFFFFFFVSFILSPYPFASLPFGRLSHNNIRQQYNRAFNFHFFHHFSIHWFRKDKGETGEWGDERWINAERRRKNDASEALMGLQQHHIIIISGIQKLFIMLKSKVLFFRVGTFHLTLSLFCLPTKIWHTSGNINRKIYIFYSRKGERESMRERK